MTTSGLCSLEPAPIEPREGQKRRTERHEQKVQRGRILRRPQKREECVCRRWLHRPRRGITVHVHSSQQHEGNDEQCSPFQQEPLAQVRLETKYRPDAESQGHHGNPRQHRIAGNHRNPAKNKHPLLVEHIPDASERAELRRLHGVQAVVQDDNGKARDGQYPPGR